jgi:protein phosphatase PTC7
VLDTAVAAVQSAGLQGSTTLCVLTVDQRTGLLRSANLGDSGFVVLSPEVHVSRRDSVGVV